MCVSPSGDAEWETGCKAAQQRLAPVDKRRNTEAPYWWGWNSELATPAKDSRDDSEPKYRAGRSDPSSVMPSPAIDLSQATGVRPSTSPTPGADMPANVRTDGTSKASPLITAVDKLPIMGFELNSVVVIYVAGVRGGPFHSADKPLTLREWLGGVYKNPGVRELNADRVWIDGILPYLAIYVRTKEGSPTLGFVFDRQGNELILKFVQLQPAGDYYKIESMQLGEQAGIAQILLQLPR